VLPPPLAWLDGFIHSIGGALGQRVIYNVESTVNPLLFRAHIKFSEKVSGKNLMLVWNLFQMYAAKNGSVPKGKASESEYSLTAEVVIKRRLGLPRKKHPLE
jgi:hypothetical protein